jgi:hypothetical protein
MNNNVAGMLPFEFLYQQRAGIVGTHSKAHTGLQPVSGTLS